MTPKQEQREAKIKFAGENPVLDVLGKINMRKTCEKHNLSNNWGIKKRIMAYVKPEHQKDILNSNSKLGNTVISGLPFGEKTVAMGWDVIQLPAVYAIVCRTTGRAFISGSTHPDLQRNVHFFWLKNWWKYGTSNTFFGNKRLIDDVKAYGVTDFYMEILEQMPETSTPKDVLRRADEYLQMYNSEHAYNRYWSGKNGERVCQFYEIDEEVRNLTDAYRKAKDEYASVYREHAALRANIIETRHKNKALVKAGVLSSSQFEYAERKLSEDYQISKLRKNGYLLERTVKKTALKKLIDAKKKFYMTNTEPF